MESDEFLKKRFAELADRCYKENRYTFTGFLGIGELASFYSMTRSLPPVSYTFYGGTESAERLMLRFGDAETFGYEEPFPIAYLEVKPLMQKYADDLSHRDILGAVMNLGIVREMVGDIYLKENVAYIICCSTMVEYVCENLTKIKHTSVTCRQIASLPDLVAGEPEELSLAVSSERIDGIVAKGFNLSRNEVNELFRRQLIYLDGRLCENNSRMLKPGEQVTVRGYGRLMFCEITGTSRKGRLYARIERRGRGK
ncbi:MAG: hypothetical protein J6S79_06395 [Lachnospiraceae bacterium]|nr:hypothetical protein [Lachnospiraceae bacterium]